MPRLTTRRSLKLESLETRELLSAGTLDLEQYALEKLNQARMHPETAAVEVTSNLNRYTLETFRFYRVDIEATRREIAEMPKAQPLAWSDPLGQAAERHALDMAQEGFQSHVGSDGSSLEDRLDDVNFSHRSATGENAFAYADSVDHAMQAFLVDYGVDSKGHRNTIFNPDFQEVGVAITPSGRPGVGPNVIVQNFGSRHDENPFLLGVVYDDRDGDGSYSIGEGRDHVTITITPIHGGTRQPDGQPIHVQPWGSGGYQIQLEPGDYEVLARSGDRVIRKHQIRLDNENVKVDFDLGERWDDSRYGAPAVAPEVAAPVFQPVKAVAAKVAPAKAQNRGLKVEWGKFNWQSWNGTARR
jgi:uncharacterized protein YkwD